MNFNLSRFRKNADGIFGYLTFDEQSLCTLENEMLAIPAGTYELTVSYSPHLEEPTPILLNVPGRTEIRIHSANLQTQLKGCIAVGTGEADFNGAEGIIHSRDALKLVMAEINDDMDTSRITITDDF